MCRADVSICVQSLRKSTELPWHYSCETVGMPDSGSRLPPSFLIDDAAELLGVSRRTVYYRIREGRLRTIRTKGGSQRVTLTSIELLLRAMRGTRTLEHEAFRARGAGA